MIKPMAPTPPIPRRTRRRCCWYSSLSGFFAIFIVFAMFLSVCLGFNGPKINSASLYLLPVDLLVAGRDDPAGSNMARRLLPRMEGDGDLYRGGSYDLLMVDGPAVSAGWIGGSYEYDGYVFLSRHAAASGRLALTCHSLGNFAGAPLGGRPREVGVPHPQLQKAYMGALAARAGSFEGFHITIEATHHGPTELDRPAAFVEVGTTERQWNDEALCGAVADVLHGCMGGGGDAPVAICFGGGHYPEKFTKMAVSGRYALGTVVPRRALADVDGEVFAHIVGRNEGASAALLDWSGMGPERGRILGMAESAGLEVVRV